MRLFLLVAILLQQRSLLVVAGLSNALEVPQESLHMLDRDIKPMATSRHRRHRHKIQKSHDERSVGILYRVKKSTDGRRRRSIADAVIETARCEHIELVDCEAYDSDEMTCMITATGMPCCICNGKLKSLKAKRKHWSLW